MDFKRDGLGVFDCERGDWGGSGGSFWRGHVKLRSLLDTKCVKETEKCVRLEIINVRVTSIYNMELYV
jgi:hypothetical protein